MHYGFKTTDREIIEYLSNRNVSKTLRKGLELLKEQEINESQKEKKEIEIQQKEKPKARIEVI